MKKHYVTEMVIVLFVLLVGFYSMGVKVEVNIQMDSDISALIGFGLPILYSFYLSIRPKPPKGI